MSMQKLLSQDVISKYFCFGVILLFVYGFGENFSYFSQFS
jgi:hypothetical protein